MAGFDTEVGVDPPQRSAASRRASPVNGNHPKAGTAPRPSPNPIATRAIQLADHEHAGGVAGAAGGCGCAACAAEDVLTQLGPGTAMPTAATAAFDDAVGGLPPVRLHADSDVPAGLGARALTVGHHVAFAPGEYRPGTPDGDALVNHELAHVVQQSGGHGTVQGAGLTYDGYEAEADRAAAAVAIGAPVELTPVRGRIGPQFSDDKPAPFARPEQSKPGKVSRDDYIDFRHERWYNDEALLRRMFEGVMRRRMREGGTQHAKWLMREFKAGNCRARGTAVFPVISAHAYGARRGDLVQNPYSFMQKEERKRRNDDAIARLCPDVTTKAERALNGLLAERRDVLFRFHGHIRKTLSEILYEGQDRINAEIRRYGIERQEHVIPMERGRSRTYHTYSMADGPVVEAMAGAAKDMVAQREGIESIEKRILQLEISEVFSRTGPLVLLGPSLRRAVQKSALRNELGTKKKQYELLVAIHGRRYPLLAAFKDDTAGLSRIASGRGRAATAGSLLFERLERVLDTRRDLEGGDIKLWKLDQVIEIAKRTGGIPRGSLYEKWVSERNQEAKDDDKIKDYVLSAIAIVLGVLAIPATGGASLALAAGSVAAGAMSLQSAIADYQLKRADNMADRAYAIAGDDPTSFWIALEVVSLGLEIAPAIKAFKALRGPATDAVRAGAGNADEAIEAAVRAAEAERRGLGKVMRAAIERQRLADGKSLAESVAGAAGHESRAIASATKRMASEADEAVAAVKTTGGAHHIKVTPKGGLVRCSPPPCDVLVLFYADQINSSPALAARWADAEKAARTAAAAGDKKAAEAAAETVRHLVDELEAIRLAPAVQAGGLTVSDMQKLLPGVPFPTNATKRLAALELLNKLSSEQRQQLVGAFRRLSKEDARKLMSLLGDQDPKTFADAMARRAKDAWPDPDAFPRMTPGGAMFGRADEVGVDAWLEVIQTTTRRVDSSKVQAARSALRGRMATPTWAQAGLKGGGWNAHHLFPVELQDHAVFMALKRTPQGWDHHNALLNSIALPTTPQLARSTGLPVHQVTQEMLSKEAGAGVLSVLRGHPQYNGAARKLLDDMTPLLDDPVALRAAVERAANVLRERIRNSPQHKDGYRVLF